MKTTVRSKMTLFLTFGHRPPSQRLHQSANRRPPISQKAPLGAVRAPQGLQNMQFSHVLLMFFEGASKIHEISRKKETVAILMISISNALCKNTPKTRCQKIVKNEASERVKIVKKQRDVGKFQHSPLLFRRRTKNCKIQ